MNGGVRRALRRPERLSQKDSERSSMGLLRAEDLSAVSARSANSRVFPRSTALPTNPVTSVFSVPSA